jgi:hypothetical protein
MMQDEKIFTFTLAKFYFDDSSENMMIIIIIIVVGTGTKKPP